MWPAHAPEASRPLPGTRPELCSRQSVYSWSQCSCAHCHTVCVICQPRKQQNQDRCLTRTELIFRRKADWRGNFDFFRQENSDFFLRVMCLGQSCREGVCPVLRFERDAEPLARRQPAGGRSCLGGHRASSELGRVSLGSRLGAPSPGVPAPRDHTQAPEDEGRARWGWRPVGPGNEIMPDMAVHVTLSEASHCLQPPSSRARPRHEHPTRPARRVVWSRAAWFPAGWAPASGQQPALRPGENEGLSPGSSVAQLCCVRKTETARKGEGAGPTGLARAGADQHCAPENLAPREAPPVQTVCSRPPCGPAMPSTGCGWALGHRDYTSPLRSVRTLLSHLSENTLPPCKNHINKTKTKVCGRKQPAFAASGQDRTRGPSRRAAVWHLPGLGQVRSGPKHLGQMVAARRTAVGT